MTATLCKHHADEKRHRHHLSPTFEENRWRTAHSAAPWSAPHHALPHARPGTDANAAARFRGDPIMLDLPYFLSVFRCFLETGVIGGVSVLWIESQSSAARLDGGASVRTG